MNTCAACRFWERDDRFNPPGIGECSLTAWSDLDGNAHPESKALVEAGGCSDSAALMTRSDFGCVQFEQRAEVEHSHDWVEGMTLTSNPPIFTYSCSCGARKKAWEDFNGVPHEQIKIGMTVFKTAGDPLMF